MNKIIKRALLKRCIANRDKAIEFKKAYLERYRSYLRPKIIQWLEKEVYAKISNSIESDNVTVSEGRCDTYVRFGRYSNSFKFTKILNLDSVFFDKYYKNYKPNPLDTTTYDILQSIPYEIIRDIQDEFDDRESSIDVSVDLQKIYIDISYEMKEKKFNNLIQNMKEEEDMKMDTMMKGMEKMFSVSKNEDLRLTFRGTLAIPTENGYISYENGTLVNNHELVLDMSGMLYNIPCRLNDVMKGDVILHDGKYLFVDDGKFITPNGTSKRIVKMEDLVLGEMGNIVTKVVSMFNINQMNSMGQNPMNMIMLMSMLGNGEGSGMESMLKMSLIGQMIGNNSNNVIQPMFNNCAIPMPGSLFQGAVIPSPAHFENQPAGQHVDRRDVNDQAYVQDKGTELLELWKAIMNNEYVKKLNKDHDIGLYPIFRKDHIIIKSIKDDFLSVTSAGLTFEKIIDILHNYFGDVK